MTCLGLPTWLLVLAAFLGGSSVVAVTFSLLIAAAET